MDNETPTMDVALWATLDDHAAAPRGDLLVHWFRTAADRLFPAGDEATAASWALVTPSMTGGGDVRVRDVRAHWGQLADALRPSPFYAAAGFHPSFHDDGAWVDDTGRVGGTRTGRGGSHTELSVSVRGDGRVADAAWCAGLVDFLAAALDGANPAFARIDHRNAHETTDLEAALKRPLRRSLRESRTLLRGYSWVTGVPAELADRLGGAAALEATGAFHAVRPLRAGGLLLQADETLVGYDDRRLEAVFRALAPLLPPGLPGDDPGRSTRVVREDAGTV
ncbi:hypothetical protein [Streptomyces californicus]|uniref:hypothetical protein n=1 Tax=Streptomyces californicus TaxID=67351 RepID=UPI0036C13738